LLLAQCIAPPFNQQVGESTRPADMMGAAAGLQHITSSSSSIYSGTDEEQWELLSELQLLHGVCSASTVSNDSTVGWHQPAGPLVFIAVICTCSCGISCTVVEDFLWQFAFGCTQWHCAFVTAACVLLDVCAGLAAGATNRNHRAHCPPPCSSNDGWWCFLVRPACR
jgi:hypothetical protein